MEIETGPIPAFILHLDRQEMMALEVGLARLKADDDKLIWGEKATTFTSYRLWRQVREALGLK